MKVDLGCGQITWRGVAEEQVLADIAAAGYAGAPLPRQGAAAEIRARYTVHGLAPAPGYFGANFWDAAQRDEILGQARRFADVSHELGVSEVYVADAGFNSRAPSGRTRREAVAHVGADDALPAKEFRVMTDTLQAVGETLLEKGVRACFHNHAGTFVETEDEIERLLAQTDPEVVFLGPDTGHLAWGGANVVDFVRRHATRIKTMHLKDVDMTVREQGAAAGWDYGTFEQHAIWTEIDEGDIDFGAIFEVIDRAGFNGWLIVETDVTQKSSPLESARVSRENLRRFGI